MKLFYSALLYLYAPRLQRSGADDESQRHPQQISIVKLYPWRLDTVIKKHLQFLYLQIEIELFCSGGHILVVHR